MHIDFYLRVRNIFEDFEIFNLLLNRINYILLYLLL